MKTEGLGGGTCAQSPSRRCYFWADVRPSNVAGNNFYQHPVDSVAAGDYGQSAKFAIYGDLSQHNFTVQTVTPHGTFYNLSQANIMIPDEYQIGVELVGDTVFGSAVVPPSNFISTYYANGTIWTPETLTGSQSSYAGPLSRAWIAYPAPGNNGGQFLGWCASGGNIC